MHFYITGILTGAGCLLACMYFTPSFSKPNKKQSVIRHFLPSENPDNIYSGFQVIDQALKKKKVIHINLNGNDVEDDKKLTFIQMEARRLKYTCDTSQMIEIFLPDTITYGRFVELVDMMLKDGHKRYALWKHNFYIFGEAPPVPAATATTRFIDL